MKMNDRQGMGFHFQINPDGTPGIRKMVYPERPTLVIRTSKS